MEIEDSSTRSPRSDSESKIKQDEVEKEKNDSPKLSPDMERKVSYEDELRSTPERSGSRRSRRESPGSVDSRPKSSDSLVLDRPKSSGSNASLGRNRRGKKGAVVDATHSVTFKVTVSLAVPTGNYLIVCFVLFLVHQESEKDG